MRARQKIPHADVTLNDENGRMRRQWREFFAELDRRIPMAGETTFDAETSVAVTFAAPEADADYRILVDASEENTFWVTDKTTTGFTLNAASTSSATVGWVLQRT